MQGYFKPAWILSAGLAVCGISSPANAATPAAATSQPHSVRVPTAADLAREAITKQLQSGETSQVNEAIAAIGEKLSGRSDSQTVTVFREQWGPQLLTLKRYGDGDRLAVAAMIAQPQQYPSALAALELLRVRALSKAGNAEAALAAAKGYYNVCALNKTVDGISVMAAALAHARPDDGEIARRFRAQQAAEASSTQPATLPSELGAPILASIKVDPAPFKDAIDAIDGWDVQHMIAKANLLLLSDRCKEARELMQQAYDTADDAADVQAATEGLARAMRAEDGSVGRANAWLVQARGKK